MKTELIQIEVQRQAEGTHIRKVIFLAPSDEVLTEYVHAICRDLGDGCASPDLEEGMVGFLRVWMRSYARQLTAKHNGGFDSRIE